MTLAAAEIEIKSCSSTSAFKHNLSAEKYALRMGDLKFDKIVYTNMSQQLVSADESLQFAVQTQLNGVIQQLERLERVADDVHRPDTMKKNAEGDRNHVTVEDNLAALKTKLMALSATLSSADKGYRDACISHLNQWHDARKGQYSPLLKRALLDSLDACTGRYKETAPTVQIDEAQLQSYAANLALANQKFHEKESRHAANPQAYIEKQQYPITHYQEIDEEVFRRELNVPSTEPSQNSSVGIGRRNKGNKSSCCDLL